MSTKRSNVKLAKECDFCGHVTVQCEQYVKCPHCKKGTMWTYGVIEDIEL